MKWKKTAAAISILLALQLILSGCWFNASKDSKVKNSEGKTENASLIPSTNDSGYQMLRPKSGNTTRGYIQYGPDNRVDMDQLESGLMDLSKNVFGPSDYVFQSGQYLTDKDINGMLYRYMNEPQRLANKKINDPSKRQPVVDGLNPKLGKGKNIVEQSKNSPKYLNYVLEQDYMKKNSSGAYKIAGMSIALSLNSVYADSINYKDKLYPISEKLNQAKVKEWGKSQAAKVVQRIRSLKDSENQPIQELQNIPIYVTLYMTSAPDSLVPGNFFASTEVASGSRSINKWSTIKQQHVLFPSDPATKDYKSDLQKFDQFKTDIQKYYPNYLGVVGKGFYQNDELSDITLEINFNKFVDKTELIGFTNYVASVVKNRLAFPQHVPVHIYISSGSNSEALVERTKDMDEPYVHIYQQ
ncbi:MULTISPECIES: CamS family sex pheromone protein [Sporolactobacillus]|jgi:protein involved in sex pheromone biosynthesis|uniref:Calcium ABC transporter ATPase n=1 Tax=Sporolactobacillus inulinus CASD TaxID=1069536 RepID=A0A0U1QQR0_9BACL|nr:MULTISPECIES: CamS family sex pheromone protein [Sporolactobacillus]KLI02956.1 calcium ABC transporter ATPase [Sporolactobacillus inulinus CASD]GEB76587.1 putative lipoprotein YerH [Sporolactobacillus inulinus]